MMPMKFVRLILALTLIPSIMLVVVLGCSCPPAYAAPSSSNQSATISKEGCCCPEGGCHKKVLIVNKDEATPAQVGYFPKNSFYLGTSVSSQSHFPSYYQLTSLNSATYPPPLIFPQISIIQLLI